jgi:hypothetical protein
MLLVTNESLRITMMIHPNTEAEALIARKDKWKNENHGVFARIAKELGVSHGKVRLTFFGAIRTIDPRVAEALANAGAPGFAAE